MAAGRETAVKLQQKVRELELELEARQEELARLSTIEQSYRIAAHERAAFSRKLNRLRAISDQPELYLDRDWRIIDYSGNMLSRTPQVAECARQRKHVRELISEDSFSQLLILSERIEGLSQLPYERGGRWRLRYSGPTPAEEIGRDWLVHDGAGVYNCRHRWRIETLQGRTRIVHEPHPEDQLDCYLMTGAEYGGAEEDLKVVCRFRTDPRPELIRDLSLVICGSPAGGAILPDMLGYTVCNGSNYNTEARIQRQTLTMTSVLEALEPDTEYEVTVERIGGRLTRRLRHLASGREAPVLTLIDSQAIYDQQHHLGLTTYSGAAEVYGIEVHTRPSRFSIETFHLPCETTVSLQTREGSQRKFRLRLGTDSNPDSPLRTLILQDVTEYHQALEALRESEERFRTVFHASPDSIALGSLPDSKYRYVNDTFVAQTGYTREETIGKGSLELGIWQDPADYDRMISTLARQGYCENLQACCRMKNGEIVPALVSARIVSIGGIRQTLVIVRDIRELETARSALSESEQRFRALVETMPCGVTELDCRGDLTFANRAYAEMLGYQVEQVIGGPSASVLAFDELGRQEYYRFMADLVREQPLPLAVIRHTSTRDGRPIDLQVDWNYKLDREGRVTGFISTVTDITSRLRAERALRENEEKYRQLFEMESDALFLISNETGKILEINASACRMYGFSREELLARRNVDLSAEPDATRGATQHRLTQIPVRWHRKQDGTVFPVEITASHFTWHEQSVHLAAMRDITERIEARQELERQRAFLKTVIDACPSFIYVKDHQARVVLANRPLAELIGRSEAELIGANTLDIFADDRPTAEKLYREDLELLSGKRELIEEEESFTDRHGRCRWLYRVKLPLRDDQGRPVQVLGVSTDITDRKRLEEEELKASKLESLGLLAGGIAHDFNNILTAILGHISLARRQGRLDEHSAEALAEAEKASFRAKDLTRQLLTFSRGGAPVKRAMAIDTLVRECVGFTLSGSRIRCNFDLPADLWTVEVDDSQFGQVIQNLVINADQAMPNGGAIKIEAANLTLREGELPPLEAGRWIRLSFTDRGGGIPPENLPRIFDPYFTTKQKGSGLGLATTYSVVKRHNGHITVESVLGHGATFRIYLPATGSAPQVDSPLSEENAARGRGARVLVMDDEEAVREVLLAILGHLGYQVAVAREGAEAIELYRRAREQGQPFDALVMDLTIAGGMGGLEAIRHLRELDPAVKALVSSGYSSDPVLANYREHGFSGMVCKPYRIEDLERELRRVLG